MGKHYPSALLLSLQERSILMLSFQKRSLRAQPRCPFIQSCPRIPRIRSAKAGSVAYKAPRWFMKLLEITWGWGTQEWKKPNPKK